MFGFFRKKRQDNSDQELNPQQMQNQIQQAIEYSVRAATATVSSMLETKELAYQFVLEEIEAASQGNQIAQKFATASGIPPEEYRGSMQNSCPEIDGPDGPQQYFIGLLQQGVDMEMLIEVRTRVVENVMKKYSFGKYGD